MSAPHDPVGTLRDGLAALERAYTPGHHGRWVAARRADLFDACLGALFEAVPSGVAVVAVGGYGRRLQLPRSDLDVLLLHDGLPASEVQGLAERLSLPFWDAGFKVGSVVRTPAECLEAARERLDSLTAMLSPRTVAGDPLLVERAIAPVLAHVQEEPLDFAGRVLAEAVRRRERYGSAAHLLEPDLKEGSGGLRDVASIGWLLTAMDGSSERSELLRPSERSRLEAAEDFLVRTRSAVHLLGSGRRAERLVMDLQPDVARAMGFTDEPRWPATDGLMRTVFEHARNVEHTLSCVLDRILTGSSSEAVTPLVDPGDVLAALADLAEEGALPSPALLDAIETAGVPDPVRWTHEVRDPFLRLLRTGEAGARMLDTLDRLGLLSRYVPSWAAVRCRPQRDPYHRSTVDAHLLGTVSNMAAFLSDGRDPDDPLHERAVNLVDHPDGALLGALLHDIGKVGEGNHVPAGTAIAADQLRDLPLEPADRDLAAFMVTEHLVLPDTATRRDLTDADLILDVAARVGTPERLAALYLLAKADARATGPAAWTTWRQALVRELVGKVQRAFERGEMGQELAVSLTERIDHVRGSLGEQPESEVDRFVLRMPRGYFLAVDPVRVARHFPTIAPTLGANEVRTAAFDAAREGAVELLVVAADRPGLLSWIAGTLTLSGISILTAQVFTTEDGAAVDLFEVEGAFEPVITDARWREVRGTLRRAVEGSISLERRVEEKRRHYPSPSAATPVTVHVDNDASDFSTVIEVGAPDRIGLLYDITRTFADLKLDVHLAKVATFEGRVVDAFYVRDALGRKIIEPEPLGEVETALRQRLA